MSNREIFLDNKDKINELLGQGYTRVAIKQKLKIDMSDELFRYYCRAYGQINIPSKTIERRTQTPKPSVEQTLEKNPLKDGQNEKAFTPHNAPLDSSEIKKTDVDHWTVKEWNIYTARAHNIEVPDENDTTGLMKITTLRQKLQLNIKE